MSKILNEKVAVITGSSRGLGLAIAKAYAREGAKIVIASRSQRSVDSAVKMLENTGAQATGLACDVADIVQVEALAEHAIRTFGQIDIWVNNAGLSAPYGPTADISSRTFQSITDTNVTGTYNGSVVALRKMVNRKHGKIINLLGRGDTGSVPLQNAYTSSKVWVRNFTQALAKEYKDSGIEIFGFNPGLVLTEMISDVEAVAGYEEKMNPLRFVTAMWGNEAEIPAQKAVWLASPDTDGASGKMVTILTPWFTFSRALVTGLRWLLRQPIKMMDMQVSSVQSAMELQPVPIEEKKR